MEATPWQFAWARSLTILLVYPVDKIVQGMWKNFLPLFADFSKTIRKNFSKAYENI
jgi:hypothetical protein